MSLRIVTINLPHPYINSMHILVDMGLYNSRSQIVRVALTEFLEKEVMFLSDLKDGSVKEIAVIMKEMAKT